MWQTLFERTTQRNLSSRLVCDPPQTFNCDKRFDYGEEYLVADLSISCNSAEYLRWRLYAVAMLFVYPLGIPFMYWVLCYLRRHHLNPNPLAVLIDVLHEVCA